LRQALLEGDDQFFLITSLQGPATMGINACGVIPYTKNLHCFDGGNKLGKMSSHLLHLGSNLDSKLKSLLNVFFFHDNLYK
jgi:hypothetical protein